MLLPTVRKAIHDTGLIRPGDHVLVGVSGGADSVALLAALLRLASRLGFRVTAAHLNHRIRGSAADEDCAFVATLCARLGVACVTGRSDVPRRARREKLSLEMAAREARYSFFTRSARKLAATVIATAHTANDRAETILLNLLRGAGMDGLSGIPLRSTVAGMAVVRPLLDVTREEVMAFLRGQDLTWREDPSNQDVAFLRNRVRHELLPLLAQRFNPSIRETLCRTADILEGEAQWLNQLAEDLLRQHRRPDKALALTGLRDEPTAARRRVLRLWLAAVGVPVNALTFDTIDRADRLLHGARGSGTLELAHGRVIRREYGRLVLDTAQGNVSAPPFRMRIRIPGETVAEEQGFRVIATIQPGVVKDLGRGPGRLPAQASIRLSAIGRRALFVRTWKPGDKIAPMGMQGSRKIQDIFVDAKVPAARRNNVPVFDCAGRILWIPGYRVAREGEIVDASRPALQLRIEAV